MKKKDDVKKDIAKAERDVFDRALDEDQSDADHVAGLIGGLLTGALSYGVVRRLTKGAKMMHRGGEEYWHPGLARAFVGTSATMPGYAVGAQGHHLLSGHPNHRKRKRKK